MLKQLIKRLLIAIPTLLIIITLAFFMMRLAPGGPFTTERALPVEIERKVLAEYGLDRPLYEQYFKYLKGVVKGDFGPSFKQRDFTVIELIKAGLPASLQIGSAAVILAMLFGLSFGIFAALKQNTWADYTVMGFAMTGIAVPTFVMAPLLTLLFGVYLGWLPVGGWGEGELKYKILPVITLALPQIAYISRLTRGSMIEVLNANYIRTARAKGLSEKWVILRHAIRGALLPVVSYLGPAIASLVTGSLVIETIYQIPGVGRYFVQAALNRDYTLVMGVVILSATLIMLMNIIVDLLYSVLDPKIQGA